MRTRVKICCMASAAEINLAVAAGADALGFVGPMPSGPGILDDETIATLAPLVPPGVTGVLLTSQTDPEPIADHVRRTGAGAVQVVQAIAPSAWEILGRQLPPAVRRIQVVHVETADGLGDALACAPFVHAFLLDSGRPSLAVPELGGTGRTHDWTLSADFVARSPRPVFLAGGLTPDNVAKAVEQVRPYGVDVCSGLRLVGHLDPGRLHAFMAAIRAVDARRAD